MNENKTNYLHYYKKNIVELINQFFLIKNISKFYVL